MNINILQTNLTQYLEGDVHSPEANKIQTWLSIVDKNELQISERDANILEAEILAEIQAYTAYGQF